jgi:DNA-binding MarR family transcriptional regulator
MTHGNNPNVDNNLVDQFQITSGLVARYADRIFYAEMGITQSKFMVLSAIDSSRVPVNQSRIAEKIQRNLNSLSMMVDRLVKSGLVIRTRSGEDRRENNLALTAEGKKKVTQGKKVNVSLNKRLVNMISVKEARGLQELLGTLEEKISSEIK